jgi:hypothetical protein
MQESPGSDKETIETHSPIPRRFQINYEFTYVAYQSKCMTESNHT